jgi:hypothetical protein
MENPKSMYQKPTMEKSADQRLKKNKLWQLKKVRIVSQESKKKGLS